MNTTIHADKVGRGPHEIEVLDNGWVGRFSVQVSEPGTNPELQIVTPGGGKRHYPIEMYPEPTGHEGPLPTDEFVSLRTVVVEPIEIVVDGVRWFRFVECRDHLDHDMGCRERYSMAELHQLRARGIHVIIRRRVDG